jgi:hypothetical protein
MSATPTVAYRTNPNSRNTAPATGNQTRRIRMANIG